MEITWHDDVTGAVGHVVIDSLIRGAASGGLRMRAGCTLEEVRGLARAMTRKEAIHHTPGRRYLPLGGAKGGIDFDPRAPGARDVLERFLAAINPIMRSYWALGEDLGVRQDDIDEILSRRRLGSPLASVEGLIDDLPASRARSHAAFAEVVDGVAQDELVGGLGVASSVLATLRHNGREPSGTTASIQGFGSMGGATARFLREAGIIVVGIADADGFIHNPRGLDVESLLASRDPFGGIDRGVLRPDDRESPRSDWLSADVDVLVPAAVSYAITTADCPSISARWIVEAANMPVSPEAEADLRSRGVLTVPDFLANSATNAWWWWVAFGDLDGTWSASRELVSATLDGLTSRVLTEADERGLSPREAAQHLVDDNLAELSARAGASGAEPSVGGPRPATGSGSRTYEEALP